MSNVDRRSELPSEIHGEIVGRSEDGEGVEAMVVSIGGTTDRPDCLTASRMIFSHLSALPL